MAGEKPEKVPRLSGKAALSEFSEKRLKPAIEKSVNFINARSAREKMMIIAFATTAIVFLDYLVLIRPVITVFRDTLPALSTLETELQDLKSDKANEKKIEEAWAEAKAALAARERAFIAPNELPKLLENLSSLAQSSGVKILNLKPVEMPNTNPANRYIGTPIHISALAGTHELGTFLSALEGGETFFRVSSLTIAANPQDMRRHKVDLDLEAYSLLQGRQA